MSYIAHNDSSYSVIHIKYELHLSMYTMFYVIQFIRQGFEHILFSIYIPTDLGGGGGGGVGVVIINVVSCVPKVGMS